MKKMLLASTCAAAISIFAAWTVSDASFAQQSTGGVSQQNTGGMGDQNMNAGQSQNERKTGPRSGEMKSGAAGSTGAASESREQTRRSAEEGTAKENRAVQGGEANQPGAGKQQMRTGERERQHPNEGRAAATPQNEPGAANQSGSKQEMKAGEKGRERSNEGRSAATPQNEPGATNQSGSKQEMKAGEKGRERSNEGRATTPQNESGAANQSGSKQEMKAGEKARERSNEGRAATPQNESGAANQPGAKQQMNAGEKGQQRSNEGRAAATPEGGAGAGGAQTTAVQGNIKMNEQQAVDFRSRLERHSDIARASVNFEARVGVDVPESVRLAPIPTDIVAEYPEFRGYDVVIVQDEIVIVDPHTRRVVEVVGGGGTNEARMERRGGRLHLTREQNEIIRRHVKLEHPAQVEFDERIDARVPDTVTLEPLPPPVVAEVPEVRSYDYFVDRSEHVVIVDPDTHEVVGIVEE